MDKEEKSNIKNLFESSPSNKDNGERELVEESLIEEDLFDEMNYERIGTMQRRIIETIGESIPDSIREKLGKGLKAVEMLLKFEKKFSAKRYNHPIGEVEMEKVLSIILAQVAVLAMFSKSAPLSSLWKVVDSLDKMVDGRLTEDYEFRKNGREMP